MARDDADDSRETPVFTERRRHRRREDDVAEHTIVERAVSDAPIVNRLLRTGKVAAAVAVICTLLGGVGAAMGLRMLGPADDIKDSRAALARVESVLTRRIDTTQAEVRVVSRMTDSLAQIMADVRTEMQLSNYTQCIIARRLAPDIRPQGCDAAGRRGSRQ